MNIFKSDLRRNTQERTLKGKECMRQFLLELELHAVFTEDVVNRLVRESLSVDNFDHDCRIIDEEGRKVPSILLENCYEYLIKDFLQYNMLDSRLPLQESTFEDIELEDSIDLRIKIC